MEFLSVRTMLEVKDGGRCEWYWCEGYWRTKETCGGGETLGACDAEDVGG